LIKDVVSGNPSDAEALGRDLAHKVRSAGAGEILAEIFAEVGR
jgi:hydroxymethylbilane synthase